MAEVEDQNNSHSEEEEEVSEEEATAPAPKKKKKAESESEAEAEDREDKDDDDDYEPNDYEPKKKGGRKPKAPGKRKKSQSDNESDEDWNKRKPAKKPAPVAGRAKKASAFTKSFKLSADLADVVGSDVMPRHEVVKKLWAVIKERELQDPKNKQYAICDEQLMKIFGIKRFRTFGMMKYLKDHFLEPA